jgi:hypothetical protein
MALVSRFRSWYHLAAHAIHSSLLDLGPATHPLLEKRSLNFGGHPSPDQSELGLFTVRDDLRLRALEGEGVEHEAEREYPTQNQPD